MVNYNLRKEGIHSLLRYRSLAPIYQSTHPWRPSDRSEDKELQGGALLNRSMLI